MPSRPARTVAASACGRSTAIFGMSSRASRLRPSCSTYSTTRTGRGASKPVNEIFARPGLPSAFGCMTGITRPGYVEVAPRVKRPITSKKCSVLK